MEFDRQVFINNLKFYRKKKNITQAQLAELCEVSTGTIGNIECDLASPSFELLIKISDVLQINPGVLFINQQEVRGTEERNLLIKINSLISSYFSKAFLE